jgi:hypothetical protein
MEIGRVIPSSELGLRDEKRDGVFSEATETVSHSQDPEKQDQHNHPVFIDEDGEEHFTAPAETAEDLVTEVIHVTDDSMLNPWTFRTWFLGQYPHLLGGCALTGRRPRSISVRWHTRDNLLLQATNSHRFRHFPGRHQLCPGRVHGPWFASEGLDWPIAQSPSCMFKF